MKHTHTLRLLSAVLVMSFGVIGCQAPKPKGTTPIPGRTSRPSGSDIFPVDNPGQPVPNDRNVTGRNLPSGSSIPLVGIYDPDLMNPDREMFRANTVYFEFDRAAIMPEDTSKIDAVAAYLRDNISHAVQIEGHCDERGTEQYNMSLGERRAQTVREYLFNAGIDPERVFTISFGESRPADPGRNDAAWARNRRAEFILLTPK